MKFTDTHCHLNRLKLENYAGDVNKALQAAREANVQRFMAIMCSLDEYDDIRSIVNANADVGMSVGVHPCEQPEVMEKASVETLVALAADEKVWAIGETGLDYHYSKDHAHAQKDSLARHIAASQQLKKPLVVHTRAARKDTIDVLTAEKAEHGILHCFTEDWATAKAALDMGFYISFSGIISFKNAQELRDVAQKVPADRMLIETDSPYLAPMPYRGKPNEPLYIPHVAAALAQVKNMPVAAVAQQTEDNFDALLAQYG